jgi:HD-GYP domain-containing protein (c-di-GMP phosphodiesterase class II)
MFATESCTVLDGSSPATWEHERAQLEAERDALADQLGQNFEELNWLRALATLLTAGDSRTNLPTMAERVLPNLRDVLRAEALVFVPDSDRTSVASRRADASTSEGEATALERCAANLVRIGDDVLSQTDLLGLVEQIRQRPSNAPVVFNRSSKLQSARLQTTARNVVGVALLQGASCYGWLIAVNRSAQFLPREGSRADLHGSEFGSYEAGLLTTAASMLAGYARNYELLRAEECLRINVIETITGALDARDSYTCGHSRRVGQYAAQIALRLGLSQEACEQIYISGLLHDVGKIGVPDHILTKPGKLTDEEFDVLKQHPTIGHTILTPLKGLAFALPGVLHHHERIDGQGYPHSLAGDDIPLEARILAVADSYDAMTSNRPYRNAMPREKAVEILQSDGGRQWDANVVGAFLGGPREARHFTEQGASAP